MTLEIRWNTFSLEILILIISYAIVLTYRYGNISPTRRGFFCDDQSIRYPRVGQTLSEIQVVVSSYSLGVSVILLTEFFVNRKTGIRSYFLCTTTPSWIYHAYKNLIRFMFALAVTMDIKFVLGNLVGRLRPCFISLCQPDVDLSRCAEFGNAYITNYTCTTGSDRDSYARQSFISAHAAVPTCAVVFVVVYIHSRWNPDKVGKLVTAFVSAVLIGATLVISLTRIKDNMHHPTDVIAGLLVGTVVAFLTTKYVVSNDLGLNTNETSCQDEEVKTI